MTKPIEVIMNESRQRLVDVINTSGLPHYLLLPIVKDVYEQYKEASENETARVTKQYNEELAKEQQEQEVEIVEDEKEN